MCWQSSSADSDRSQAYVHRRGHGVKRRSARDTKPARRAEETTSAVRADRPSARCRGRHHVAPTPKGSRTLAVGLHELCKAVIVGWTVATEHAARRAERGNRLTQVLQNRRSPGSLKDTADPAHLHEHVGAFSRGRHIPHPALEPRTPGSPIRQMSGLAFGSCLNG